MDNFYDKKSVFIAGGAGMAGQSLMRSLLDRGAHVLATEFVNRKIDCVHKNLSVINMDLRDRDATLRAMKEMDVLFIAAAKVGGAKLINNSPLDLISYNLDIQFGLLETAFKARVDRVGFISSSYVYPHTGKPNIESEGFLDDPWKPKNYGLGWIKRYLETVCKFLHMSGTTKFAIIRPASMYGPYDNFDLETCHAVPALVKKMADQTDPMEVWGDGQELRCHTYIDDVVDGLLVVTERYAVADAVNICNKDPVRIIDVVNTLSEITGFKPTINFNTDKPSTIPYKVSCPQRAKEMLGWESKTSLKDGLQKTLNWYLNH